MLNEHSGHHTEGGKDTETFSVANINLKLSNMNFNEQSCKWLLTSVYSIPNRNSLSLASQMVMYSLQQCIQSWQCCKVGPCPVLASRAFVLTFHICYLGTDYRPLLCWLSNYTITTELITKDTISYYNYRS